ncbi:TPA: ABC transporter permease [Candidatus Poribacteria bacterium]|nr:ABC transporter permease [Candidatus Poribacteria bacterium]
MKNYSIFKNNFRVLRKTSYFNILIILIFLIIISSIFSKYFLDYYNIQSLLRDLAFIGLITLAQCLLLILGDIDLSLGKISALSGVIAGILMVQMKVNPFLSLILCLVFGSFLGLINGLLVSKLKLNSLVVTVGMSGVYGGFNLVFTQGRAITNIPKNIYFLGQGYIFKLPTPFIFMIIFTILIILMAEFTRPGRYIYAVGNNSEAAKILGINVDNIRIFVFTLAGFLSSIAGVLMVARLGTSQPGIGESWPLNSIAGCVIGGVSLTGGVGEPIGAILGISVIIIIQNMIVLFGVSPYWQTAVSGIIVVIAIAIGALSNIMSEKQEKSSQLKTTLIE